MTKVLARLDPMHPDHIVVESGFEHKDAIQKFLARKWSVADKVWVMPLAWSSYLQLWAEFQENLEVSDDLQAWIDEHQRTVVDPANKLRETVKLNDDDGTATLNEVTVQAGVLEGELELFPHQATGAAFMATNTGCGIFDETGTGKSAQTISALRAAHRAGDKDIFPVLIVAPNSVKRTWQREWKQWWPGTIVHIVDGSVAGRRKILETPGHVYIVNYEQMHRHSRLSRYGSTELKRCTACGGLDEKITNAKCEVHERELNQIPFNTVVCDECFTAGTKISSPLGDINIEDIKAGDVVYGFDHDTGEVVENVVESLYSRDATSVLPGVNATPNHPYFVEGEGYRPIGDIEADDKIVTIMRGMQKPVVKLESGEVLLRRMQDAGAKNVLEQPQRRKTQYGRTVPSDAYTNLLGLFRRVSATASAQLSASEKAAVSKLLEEVEISADVRDLWEELLVSVSESKILQSNMHEDVAKKFRDSENTIRSDDSGITEPGIKASSGSGSTNDREQSVMSTRSQKAIKSGWSERLEIVSRRTALDSSISDAERLCIAVLNCFDGVSGQNGGWSTVSELLHLRHSISQRESSSRDRWLDSSSTQGIRPASYGEIREDGLVGYPILAVRDSEKYSRMSAEGERALDGETVTVYSMSTRQGNYFADDALVRNCHRMLHPSKQTRAIWSVSDKAKRRYALTGTPIQNDINDFWFILRYIRPKEFPSKLRFIDRYADTGYSQWGILEIYGIRKEYEDEFRAVTEPLMRRMLKKIVLPFLPPIIKERRYIEMAPAQRKAYKQMLKDATVMLDKGETLEALTASSPLSVATRLLQFASSYGEIIETETAAVKQARKEVAENGGDPESVPLEESLRLALPSNKIAAFLGDVESGDFGDSSIVVFAQSRQLIELLSDEMTKKTLAHGLITGSQSTEERQQAIDDFQDGKLKYILVTIQAGGVGLTLTAADVNVFLQRSYSSTAMAQALSRSHRIGSEIHDSVTIIDYISEHTIEDRQLGALESKSGRIESILKDRELLRKFLVGEDD